MADTAIPEDASPPSWDDLPRTMLRSLEVDAPSPNLDPYLDATASVLERQGWSKTTIPDIARLMGVSRTTVYRQLGSVDAAVRLLVARELRRLADSLPRAVPQQDGAEAICRVLAATVGFLSGHPVIRKLVQDEPGVIAAAAVSGHTALVATLRPAIAPALEAGMASGAVAPRDVDIMVEWIVRIGTSLVLNPPNRPLLSFVECLLLPVLEPVRARR